MNISRENLRETATLIPIISVTGLILAITFDVGYFWGIDVNLFTLFSLSEHLVFALEAAPILILILFVLFLVWPIINWSQLVRSDRNERKSARRRIALYAFYAVGIALFVFAIYREYYEAALLPPIAFLISYSTRRMSLGMTSGTPLLISVAAFAIMSSLVAGHGLGRGYLKGDKVTHTIKLKNDVVLFGRLIRSGERGVLFYESASKKLSFKTWADIAILERRL